MTFWDRPLHAMTDAFTAAGFRIAVISEPPAVPDTPRELFPPEFEGRSFLAFLFFVLESSQLRLIPGTSRPLIRMFEHCETLAARGRMLATSWVRGRRFLRPGR